MPKIKIDKDRCKGCYLCVVNCPNGLIKVSGALNVKGVKPAYFSGSSKCTACGMCFVICPDCGIKVLK
ncbi:MAG: 4Fe-4S binding protein [Candidatus Omnitrophota bacterium]|nr:4Fe-4S binding protein [Candidatus Omnitrophota bacterium]